MLCHAPPCQVGVVAAELHGFVAGHACARPPGETAGIGWPNFRYPQTPKSCPWQGGSQARPAGRPLVTIPRVRIATLGHWSLHQHASSGRVASQPGGVVPFRLLAAVGGPRDAVPPRVASALNRRLDDCRSLSSRRTALDISIASTAIPHSILQLHNIDLCAMATKDFHVAIVGESCTCRCDLSGRCRLAPVADAYVRLLQVLASAASPLPWLYTRRASRSRCTRRPRSTRSLGESRTTHLAAGNPLLIRGIAVKRRHRIRTKWHAYHGPD